MAKTPKSPGQDGPEETGEAGSGDGQPSSQAGSTGSSPEAGQAAPQLQVLAQFVRDLSFESPNAPVSLQAPGANPKLDINVNVQSAKRGDDLYDVALKLEARATNESGVIYNIELVYAGLFRLSNIPQNLLQGILFVDCPTLLFPYLRRIVADVTQDGSFPPLMLNPIDFAALYRQNAQRAQAQARSQAEPVKN